MDCEENERLVLTFALFVGWLDHLNRLTDTRAAQGAEGSRFSLNGPSLTGRGEGTAAGAGRPALTALPFVGAGGVEHDCPDASAQGVFGDGGEGGFDARTYFLGKNEPG